MQQKVIMTKKKFSLGWIQKISAFTHREIFSHSQCTPKHFTKKIIIWVKNNISVHNLSHHNLRLKLKFWILMVSSERWILVQIYQDIPYFKFKNYFLSIKNQFKGIIWKIVGFFFKFFFRNISLVQWFCKLRWLHRTNHIKI